MFKVEKLSDKVVLTIYGYVGGYYLEPRNIAGALDEVIRSGYRQCDIHIHTNGGDVFEGNLILNLFRAFKGRIDLYIDGVAASMGAILPLGLPKEQVHIAENGFLMIHPPKSGLFGNRKEFIAAVKLLTSIEKDFKAKLANRLNKTAEEIESGFFDGADHWIDADEAITLGIAGDKFTIDNGAVTYGTAEAATSGVQAVINSYSSLITDSTNQSFPKMKQVNMTLKLKEDAPEPEAVSAINAIQARADEAERKLAVYEQKENDAKKAEAKRLLDAAQAEQRIDAENRPKWEAKFEKDHEGTSELLASIPKRTLAKDVVESPDSKADEALLAMSWSEADKAGRTAEMRAKFPEEYKEKFKAEFGVDPK